MRYDRQQLIDEINRFINTNGRYPKYNEMRVKDGYPSINAYINEFGSFTQAILEMEEQQHNHYPDDIINIPDFYTKWNTKCSNDIEYLSLLYPNIPVEILYKIYNLGYSTGCDASDDAYIIQMMKELYL